MENCRKNIFPIFGAALLMAFSVSVYVRADDGKQTEVKKSGMAQAMADSGPLSAPSNSVSQEAQPVAAEQAPPVVPLVPAEQPAAVPEPVAPPMPAEQPAAIQEPIVPATSAEQPVAIPEPAVPATQVAQPAVVQEPAVPATQAAQPAVAPEPAVPATQVAQPAVASEPAVPATQVAQPAVAPELAVPATQAAQPAVAQEPVDQTPSAAQPLAPVVGEIVTPIPNPYGVIEVKGYKYPVYLYAPKDYKTDRTYSLIMMAPAESVKAQEQIAYLTGLAQRRSVFILSPHVLWPKPGDTPYELDKWLFEVKRDIVERFPINRKRVYLFGKNSGAHYAAYLATQHPQEFSAVALFGEAWDGPFSQLIIPSSDPVKQVPFYIALKTGSDAKARNQAWFDRLQKKGYVLYLTEYPTEETLNDLEFKKTAYEWLEEASQSWIAEVAKRHQGWKGQLKKGFREFFTV